MIQAPAANDPLREKAIQEKKRKSEEQKYDDLPNYGLVEPEEVDTGPPILDAVYYALDHHDRFWVLAFDIDAKDIAKQSIADEDQSFEDVTNEQVENSGLVDQPPKLNVLNTADEDPSTGERNVQTYPYRFEDIEQSIVKAFELKEWLTDTVGFSTVRIYYSGQGTHVYALDDDPYYKFTQQSRQYLTAYIKERLQIPVDDAVTWDDARVIRLPGSLHSDVCRVVTEIESPEFNFRQEAKPAFLKDAQQGEVQ